MDQTDINPAPDSEQEEPPAAPLFADYQSGLAAQSLRRQGADLRLFAEYLSTIPDRPAVTGSALGSRPEAWAGVTAALVAGFVSWQVESKGHKLASANVRLSTVKNYALLASLAGVIPPAEYAAIRGIAGGKG